MAIIDQNNAFTSLSRALVPAPSLLDGRTERDMLGFLSDFASLINFYDNNNLPNGSWEPFLLKDPVFLQASISKTKFSTFYSLYVNTCIKLEKILASMTNSTPDTPDITFSFNQLFDQLIAIFMKIKRWVYYMQRSDDEYSLKTYVVYQVKTNFSRYFWAIISLKQNLFLSAVIKGIEPVDENSFLFFDTYDELVWKQNKDKSPYWEILELKYPIKENSTTDFFQALTKVGDELFNFFNTIIEHSIISFENNKTNKSKYPDTTLLRVFVNLLKVQQDQLNKISHKHLEFYYKNILHQKPQPATPDEVFITALLSKKDTTFTLPAGTQLSAGFDDKKNIIIFNTEKEVNLNPATIAGAFTLTQQPAPGNFSSLYFQSIDNPALLQKDDFGIAKKWSTFGNVIPSATLLQQNVSIVNPALLQKDDFGMAKKLSASATSSATLLQLGVAIASPLLLLREGKRNVTLNFTFAKAINIQVLQNAIFSLSTQAAWLKVAATVQYLTGSVTNNKITIQISLTENQPPIESFLINPDDLKDAAWPMLKIEFNSFPDPANPPVLTNFDIKVNVTGVRTFQLYNDYGLLDGKTYQPFGPTPLLNSGFMIGNNEIFSKPVNALSIELDWDKLPDDFFVYYQQYNDCVNNLIYPKKNIGLWTKVKNAVKNIFHRKPLLPLIYGPFNNTCFTVNFSILQNESWKTLNMLKKEVCAIKTDNTFSCIPYLQDPTCKSNEPVINVSNLLFSTDGKCVVTPSSFFGYDQPAGPKTDFAFDPYIQNTPLKFSEKTASGFMKMAISGPVYGFGSALYPNVVYEIAIANASVLKTDKQASDFKLQPNLPFAPKLTNFVANYTASESYDFKEKTGTYPLQIFLYSPFQNYTAYDNTKDYTDYTDVIDKLGGGPAAKEEGVNLFTSLEYKGFLFLAMDNLVAAGSISFYFELAREYVIDTTATKEIGYFYLSDTGWKELSLLSDETNDFSCSGIIQLNVPDDIANKTVYKSDKYWFAIAVKNDPASFAQTFFVQTNGIRAKRSGEFLFEGIEPSLPANLITKPLNAIPQIASFLQPFPSFGGKAAEDQGGMNQRISTRLKTKDRVVTTEDYFRIIKEEFTDIFYSKSVVDPKTKKIITYVVKSYANYKEPNAFTPLISTCKENKIATYLNKRSSAFVTIEVSNFSFQYVQVIVTVSIKQGFEKKGVEASINDALNIYLSPWIKDSRQQLQIDQGINDAEVAKFIKTIDGVSQVESIVFTTYTTDAANNKVAGKQDQGLLLPTVASNLFVSYMNHLIQCNTEA